MIKHPIGIFISGRGSNLKSIVDACKEKEYPAEIKVVFSNNKNAPGLRFAKENNLEAITLDFHSFKNTEEYEEKIINLLKPYDLELICLAGYMKILSKKFSTLFTRCFEEQYFLNYPILTMISYT